MPAFVRSGLNRESFNLIFGKIQQKIFSFLENPTKDFHFLKNPTKRIRLITKKYDFFQVTFLWKVLIWAIYLIQISESALQ